MKIQPSQIIQSGHGVDLSNLPEDMSIQMSDPVADFGQFTLRDCFISVIRRAFSGKIQSKVLWLT